MTKVFAQLQLVSLLAGWRSAYAGICYPGAGFEVFHCSGATLCQWGAWNLQWKRWPKPHAKFHPIGAEVGLRDSQNWIFYPISEYKGISLFNLYEISALVEVLWSINYQNCRIRSRGSGIIRALPWGAFFSDGKSRGTVSSQDSIFTVLVLRVIVLVSTVTVLVLLYREQDSSRHQTTEMYHLNDQSMVSKFVKFAVFVPKGQRGHSIYQLG